MSNLKKILHIEDDGLMQAIVKASLKASGGFEVVCASSGNDALAILENYLPDLILLDVIMPGMDGPETMKRLKDKIDTTRTCVIFMTARVDPQETDYYRSLGAAGVIIKPFDPMALPQEVNTIMQNFQTP